MKKCSKCQIEKPASEFAGWQRNGKYYLNSYCKSCKRIYNNTVHVVKDKPKRQIRMAAVRKAVADLIRTAKEVPCADCGIQYPPQVMEFDHLDPSQKSFDVSEGRRRTIGQLRKEIAKCEVVCANCHRMRPTFRRPRD